MGSASLKANEPSMEDILASIRRIIADDQETLQPPEPEVPPPSPLRNVLDLAELHVSPLLSQKPLSQLGSAWDRNELPEETSLGSDLAADILRSHRAERPDPVPAMADETGEALLSTEASASVTQAFEQLGASLRPSQPLTVEDLMREMLRPMLKAWLDDNLPSLVERLVRAEIERVARCRG
ncbi:PopZ family protein [Microvirga aerilata]